jgi:hypothetical protein
MLDDKQVTSDGLRFIKRLCRGLKVTGAALATQLGDFHSIDQLQHWCREWDEIAA